MNMVYVWLKVKFKLTSAIAYCTNASIKIDEIHVETKQLIDLIENDALLNWNGVEKFVDQLKWKATNRFCLLIFFLLLFLSSSSFSNI